MDLDNTMFFKADNGKSAQVHDLLKDVYTALEEKGYDPINQIVGYLLSGDPAYITSYSDARSKIRKMDRDELVEELLRAYLK